jgi:GNAT superfamily N-acetyltransferase
MIVVRRAELDDAEAVASVLYDSFVEYESLYAPQRFAATVQSAEGIRERLEQGPCWVAMVDEAIVGTVAAVGRLEGLYVRGMGIVPAARGLGIGEKLLEEVETYAIENGFERIFLGTTPFLPRAIRLYERFGFVFNEEKNEDSYGTPLLYMEKLLCVN